MLLAVPEGLRRASLWAVYVSETYDTGGKPTKTDLRRSDRPPSEASRAAAAGKSALSTRGERGTFSAARCRYTLRRLPDRAFIRSECPHENLFSIKGRRHEQADQVREDRHIALCRFGGIPFAV
jgi:hypothetical protein